MISTLLLTMAIVMSLSNGKVLKWTSNPYLIPPASPMSTTQYLVFHGQLALNYTLSRVRCEALGGDLADVDSMEVFQYLHSRLHSPAFIASFEGKSYGSSGLALYPGGAVAIPTGGANNRFPSICEVPLMGTFSIDLSRYGEAADRSVRVGEYKNATAAADESNKRPDPNIEELARSGFVQGRRDPRFAGLSQQVGPIGARSGSGQGAPKELAQSMPTSTQSVVTVTIYGSIETDPALPCCRCCNEI